MAWGDYVDKFLVICRLVVNSGLQGRVFNVGEDIKEGKAKFTVLFNKFDGGVKVVKFLQHLLEDFFSMAQNHEYVINEM